MWSWIGVDYLIQYNFSTSKLLNFTRNSKEYSDWAKEFYIIQPLRQKSQSRIQINWSSSNYIQKYCVSWRLMLSRLKRSNRPSVWIQKIPCCQQPLLKQRQTMIQGPQLTSVSIAVHGHLSLREVTKQLHDTTHGSECLVLLLSNKIHKQSKLCIKL